MKNRLATQAIEWAAQLHTDSSAQITPAERTEQEKYAALIQNPNDKTFLSKVLDESSQIRDDSRLSERIKYMIEERGIPKFFSPLDQSLMKLHKWAGYIVPGISMPVFKYKLHHETRSVIIDEKRPALTKHLGKRLGDNIGQNINLLGEVVLSDHEADTRYEHYLKALEQPDINYISIKLSGIYAQMHPLNFEQARKDLIERLTTIYQKAIDFPYVGKDGASSPKFVNLDMEEYKDAHLTLELFKTVLSLPQFKSYTAGLVIQAYLCDAEELFDELLEFAHQRVKSGGAPLKVRLVKGANLQMESVISSLRDWPNPVRESKVSVDANYLHLLDKALLAENAKVLHVGIASHNLFTLGYAHTLSKENGAQQWVTFEMLEGMANHIWRALKESGAQIILYTPIVSDAHFLNAVSYLVRRLDENTGPENFLSYSFNLKLDSKEWEFLRQQFEEAVRLKDNSQSRRTRTQDRNLPYIHKGTVSTFKNEPDTDFDLEPNKQWAEKIAKKWQFSTESTPIEIPVQIGAELSMRDKKYRYIDHNQPQAQITTYLMSQASDEDTTKILDIAHNNNSWRTLPLKERTAILHRTADLLAERRGDLIGCMCAVTGKTITEGDVEVSEAIDFCRFYPLTMADFESINSVSISPKGTILVISPWNFPLAIPVGGVAAALSGGNNVILKPASSAAPVAWEFAQAFWDAGVPREALQVVICETRQGLNILTSSPSVKHTILTGGTDTAQSILKNNPITPLSAETGGKNAIIVTGAADRDKAIMNIISSAFGNAGQKCSACSLLLLEAEVYDDPIFKSKLRDAAMSMKVGFNWDLGTVVGTMITNKNDKLHQALQSPEPHTEWLVAPKYLDTDKFLLSPTILWGVRPGDFTFSTELFAPVLSVVRVNSLQHAIDLVNSLDYGLTSGLQSLDEREQKLWHEQIVAGNLYINRGTTGAIVNRQPFGGMKLSAFGGGIKAGGVNYTSCFVRIQDRTTTSAEDAQKSYQQSFESTFSHATDVNNLYGEQNFFRYRPLKSMALRLFPTDSQIEIQKIIAAASAANCPLTISTEAHDPRVEGLSNHVRIKYQSLDEFYLNIGEYERIRIISTETPRELYEQAAKHNIYVADAPVVSEGRVELLHYLKEQSVSIEYHRYGSIFEPPQGL